MLASAVDSISALRGRGGGSVQTAVGRASQTPWRKSAPVRDVKIEN